MTGFASVPIPVALEGGRVRLEALTAGHADDLASACVDGGVRYAHVPEPDGIRDHIAMHRDGVARGERVAYAVRDLDAGRAVGVTCYLNPRTVGAGARLYALELGATWLAVSARGTTVNPQLKLLLLQHAFDGWGVDRVDIKTDARNAASRGAILKLGAVFEGIQRRAHPSRAPGEEGLLRDTAYYSMTQEDWPRVRAGLQRRLAEHATR